ncbi:MAG TPA: response regulator transcription factor [Candidatus Polarisedimenticolia bacterium]|nr:response regulator transcription factor [Candidatus Polarisedimenticolia bacterium]
MAETVLVVDDEKDIVDLLDYNLRQAGFRVLSALNGEDAVEMARARHPRLVLLDLMLPDLSGTEVLKLLRASPATRSIPVILLTARNDEIDRLLGFELGADDYVSKPFSVRELILRVRAVLKRGGPSSPGENEPAEQTLSAGPIEVDPGRHEVRVAGRPIELTITEFRLLADLVKARGRVRSRDVLLSEVWGYDSEVMSRTVDTHVRRLRDKLGAAAGWLHTVRGVGYRIQDPQAD